MPSRWGRRRSIIWTATLSTSTALPGPLDPQRLDAAVKMTRAASVAVVPTMVLWETILGAADLDSRLQFEELVYVPLKEVAGWTSVYKQRLSARGFDAARARQIVENRKILLKALNDGGVQILFGTDSPQ